MIFHSSASLWLYMLLLDVLYIFYKTKFDAEKGLVSRMDPGHCIYKVSKSIRNVKPQAYRPQVVLIGLHNRSIKQTANDGAGTSSDQGYAYSHTILSLSWFMEQVSLIEI